MTHNAALTHIALRVKDMDASIAFYQKYAGLHIVHDRVDDGVRVVWLSEVESEPDFVFVLMVMPAAESSPPRPVDHFGFAVASTDEVDRLAALAEEDGILVLKPTHLGPVVGYISEVADPDGNVLEFSFGQSINPRHLPEDG